MSFDDLHRAWPWRPIPGCPGRFRLDLRGAAAPSLVDLVRDASPSRHHVAGARDEVFVVPLVAGAGLLSYRHADGSWIHTLNTPEGLARKLTQLGIPAAEVPR